MKALLLLVLPWLSPANYTDNVGNLHILYSELWVTHTLSCVPVRCELRPISTISSSSLIQDKSHCTPSHPVLQCVHLVVCIGVFVCVCACVHTSFSTTCINPSWSLFFYLNNCLHTCMWLCIACIYVYTFLDVLSCLKCNLKKEKCIMLCFLL